MKQRQQAWVRPPTPSFVKALSSHPDKGSIQFQKALEQHQNYVIALQQAGLQVKTLPPLEEFPDSVFIEDNAVLFPGKALICSMRAPSRQGEGAHTRPVLETCMDIFELDPSAHLDGGDVIQTEHAVYVGQSQRTGPEAINALEQHTDKPVIPVQVIKGLHLKTGASYLGRNTLLIDPESVDPEPFKEFDRLETGSEESYAANCLAIQNKVIFAEGYPRLEEQLQERGWDIQTIPMGEFEKADGGITCLSLILPE